MFTVSVKCGHYDFRPRRQKYQLRHWSQTARMYSSLSVSNQISNPYKRASPAGLFIGRQIILNPVTGSTFQTSLNVWPIVLICGYVFCCLFEQVHQLSALSSEIRRLLQWRCSNLRHTNSPLLVSLSVGKCLRNSHQLKQFQSTTGAQFTPFWCQFLSAGSKRWPSHWLTLTAGWHSLPLLIFLLGIPNYVKRT